MAVKAGLRALAGSLQPRPPNWACTTEARSCIFGPPPSSFSFFFVQERRDLGEIKLWRVSLVLLAPSSSSGLPWRCVRCRRCQLEYGLLRLTFARRGWTCTTWKGRRLAGGRQASSSAREDAPQHPACSKIDGNRLDVPASAKPWRNGWLPLRLKFRELI